MDRVNKLVIRNRQYLQSVGIIDLKTDLIT